MVRITIKYTQKASVKSNSAFTDLTLKYNNKKTKTKQNYDQFSLKKNVHFKKVLWMVKWNVTHSNCSKKLSFFSYKHLSILKQRAATQKYRKTSPAKAFFLLHLAAMTVGGPVENTNTHTLYLYYTSMHGTSM